MDAVALVEHYIEHHCHAQTVAFLHKVLVVGGRAIGLVGSHVEVGVVSPALVAAEFHYGKQLDYVHTQFLQIRQPCHGTLYGSGTCGGTVDTGEVAQKKFVDNKIVVVGNSEGRELIVVHVAAIHCQEHTLHLVGRIARTVAPCDIHLRGVVVVGVENKMCIWIGYLVLVVDNVVIRQPLVFWQAGNCNPEIAVPLVVVVVHNVLLQHLVVVPGGHEHHRNLAGGSEAESHRAVAVLHRTHFGHTAGIGLGA